MTYLRATSECQEAIEKIKIGIKDGQLFYYVIINECFHNLFSGFFKMIVTLQILSRFPDLWRYEDLSMINMWSAEEHCAMAEHKRLITLLPCSSVLTIPQQQQSSVPSPPTVGFSESSQQSENGISQVEIEAIRDSKVEALQYRLVRYLIVDVPLQIGMGSPYSSSCLMLINQWWIPSCGLVFWNACCWMCDHYY